MAEHEGVGLGINARTDVFLVRSHPIERRALRRFSDAGACASRRCGLHLRPDMGNVEKERIGTLAEGTAGPVNVIAGEKTPSIPDLKTIVIRRLSFGPRPMRAALERL